ncbi:acyltransferase-domain-containing protein [Macroventuria anomochaeta]|uniref:Acyltransferase-domain-containing protein n=1 Tax=Macroventuria anomochaeta TaxID=301207 RepID=A0ACB6S8N0_9PLEO|nr:acyltransferase-domain-containing protein [Macroventuria anomochaeta]KAF2630408.1 acyltransferase-domain-containing protein [Macroventuria anomochaeta]
MDTTPADAGLKQRHPPASVPPQEKQTNGRPKLSARTPSNHPGGRVKHGAFMQFLRMCAFAAYFNGSIVAIFVTQAIGAPLYYYSKDVFYAWMAMTKQHFGIVVTTMTYWWAPVKMRISGDASVRGQLRRTEDGRIECDFPERMVLISNHQIYTDWVYLWWIAYTSSMHGHLYIILKESIKYIPILGTGMMFYGFIFLSRKWATDKQRFQYRLKKLSTRQEAAVTDANPRGLNPMWLLIFPEGTNLSSNGRIASKKWADKNDIPDLRHALLPRSTGLSYCLQELRDTVDYMYDCTLAYEGVPVGQYGQDLFSLRGSYFQGRPPKSVNMHWRRFATKDIPLGDEKVFGDWLLERWREKDELLQYYIENNKFPADDGVSADEHGNEVRGAGWIETEVRPAKWFEWVQVYVPTAAVGLLLNVVLKMVGMVLRVLHLR